MAKWSGTIGFATTVEVEPGLWEDKIIARHYYGDLLRIYRDTQSNTDTVNDDIIFNNRFSVVADPYLNKNFQKMRYIEYWGNKWKVTSVEVQFPRLIISVGGIYNGPDET